MEKVCDWTRTALTLSLRAYMELLQIQSREWDSGKPGVKQATEARNAQVHPSFSGNIGIRGAVRGGAAGRGRGGGRTGAPSTSNVNEKPAVPTQSTAEPTATTSPTPVTPAAASS